MDRSLKRRRIMTDGDEALGNVPETARDDTASTSIDHAEPDVVAPTPVIDIDRVRKDLIFRILGLKSDRRCERHQAKEKEEKAILGFEMEELTHKSLLSGMKTQPSPVDDAPLQTLLGGTLERYELPNHQTTKICCARVCMVCCVEDIQTAIRENWWFRLNGAPDSPWIECASPDCDKILPIGDSRQLKVYLSALGCSEKVRDETTKLYDHLCRFRQELYAFNQSIKSSHGRTLSNQELRDAKMFHQELVKSNLMHDFTEEHIVATIENDDDDEAIQRYFQVAKSALKRPGVAEPAMIPLFHNLARVSRMQECAVCYDKLPVHELDPEMYHIEDGSTLRVKWTWSWDEQAYANFPRKIGHEHEHACNTCRACVENHIGAALKNNGRLAVDRITCPTYGCNRHLTFREIEVYASKMDLRQYKEYQDFIIASRHPDFRHCSNDACKGWFVGRETRFEDDERFRNILTCDMPGCEEARTCFEHQVPWHDGLSCAEYDEMKEGSPEAAGDEALTGDGIERKIKRCPECRVPIERREYCYHMTCAECHHEFCWVCMVPWFHVIDRITGRHEAAAHADDCFFRDGNFDPNQTPGMTGLDGTRLPELDISS